MAKFRSSDRLKLFAQSLEKSHNDRREITEILGALSQRRSAGGVSLALRREILLMLSAPEKIHRDATSVSSAVSRADLAGLG